MSQPPPSVDAHALLPLPPGEGGGEGVRDDAPIGIRPHPDLLPEGEATKARALAIETSGRIGSVALVEDGRIISQETFPHGLQHAARIIPAIDSLMQAAKWKPGDLAEIYVSGGPGSFTGLRIGITLTKTFAFATGAKIVAVPTVRVLVENAPDEARHVIIVLDAKREQIFTAGFERDASGWVEKIPAHLGTLTDMLGRVPRPVHLMGEGIPYHRKFIPGDDSSVVETAEDSWRARAEIVAKLGWGMAREGIFTDPYKLIPLYIRKPEAEEKYEAASMKTVEK